MKIPEVVTLDFETLPIQKRPDYPPKPVSMSIQMPHWPKPRFFAWGHLTGRNTCTESDAKRIIHAVRDSGLPILCHNSRFDTDLAETHFGVAPWSWNEVHDTQFLMFLVDPHARSLGLKETAAERLKMPPDERDAVKEWIVEHKEQLERDFPEIVTVYAPATDKGPGGIKPSNASAFIAYAPPEIVEAYCDGDVARTLALFKSTYKEVAQRKMLTPYDRERRLSPILLKNEREGISVDLPGIQAMDVKMEDALAVVNAWLRRKLRAPDLNCDSGDEIVDALIRTGLGDNFIKTPTGKDSRSVESVEQAVTDKKLKAALQYRTRLTNQHRNFVKGWRRQAEKTGGTIHTVWNQVRNGDKDMGGARTGRLSTNAPNVLAITKALGRKAKDAVHPAFLDVLELPFLRSFLLPDEGCVWMMRDISQQEYRLCAHATEGALYEAYRSNRKTDVHEFVDLKIQEILSLDLGRDTVKTLNFGMLFGMGVQGLMLKTGRSYDECKRLREAHAIALPDIKAFDDDLKAMGKRGEYIQTWGGRQYYSQEPSYVKSKRTGQMELRTHEFKLLNVYTQGGGADMTKEILIRYDGAAGRTARLLAPIHDELDTSCPRGQEREQSELLREVIASIELDVPVLSECKIGPNWGALTKYEDVVQ